MKRLRSTRTSLFAATLASVVTACGGSNGDSSPGDSGSPTSRPDAGDFVPPVSVDCSHVGTGTAYDVGDGQTYASLGEVPWYALGPGDTVRIHFRAEPYREKILISNSGAEGQPIRICGVAGPGGELPVIDGTNATTSPNQHWSGYLPLQDTSLIMITPDEDDAYGYRPEWITIEGLVIRGAHTGNTFTNSEGEVRSYESFSAGLYVVPAAHLVVRGNVFTDNGLGLFTLSKDETDNHVVEDLVLEGNYFFGNGVVGAEARHNCYIQGLGVLVQYNRFGRLRPGALGGNLKDRSAGTTVRYNWIEGGARQLDLVDAQEHAQHAVADPRYRETFVYGNLIINDQSQGDGGHIVHYGGDTLGFEQNFRKGTLYFYNNTVITTANASERWRTAVIEVATNDETVDMRNNIIVRHGDTNMALLSRAGRLELGVNWISRDYWPAYEDFQGTVTGEQNLIVGSDPLLDETYRPRTGSAAIDAAQQPAPAAPACDREYVPHQQGAARPVHGAGTDLGAFEGP